MTFANLALFALGLLLLLGGADALVRGASRMAKRFGISPTVVGVTVVALGSSSPEIAVSVFATLRGQPDLAVGNVVGSNIFNVLLALGAAATVTPLFVAKRLIRQDTPFMVGACVLVTGLALDGELGRGDASLLCILLVAYVAFSVRRASTEFAPLIDREDTTARLGAPLLYVVMGIATLFVGSRLLVSGATGLARAMGVSDLIIGLTVVAAGTGLPEAATSVVAALRGERDLAVANVVGSNTLNIFGVLGPATLLSPDVVKVAPSALHFDLPVMVAAALVCLPMFFAGSRISRTEGGLLVAYYVAYVAYLVLAATNHEAIEPFSLVMIAFVIPLSLVAVLVPAIHEWRRRRRLVSGTHS